jgi:hypothetical protein
MSIEIHVTAGPARGQSFLFEKPGHLLFGRALMQIFLFRMTLMFRAIILSCILNLPYVYYEISTALTEYLSMVSITEGNLP